jgi:hypothetical protein
MGGATREFEVHIIDKMDSRFFDDNKPWTYLKGGKGANAYARTYNGETVTGPGVDCSEFVRQTMLASGYNVGYAPTATMKGILDGASSNDYSKVADYKNIKVGDVLVFNNTNDNSGHTGVVRQYDPETGIGVYSGSQSSTNGVVKYVAFTTDPAKSLKNIKVFIPGEPEAKKMFVYSGSDKQTLEGVLRVKESTLDPSGAKTVLDQKNQDIDKGLSGKKLPKYFGTGEPTSSLEGGSEQHEVSIFDDNGDGITVTRPFVT